jgi:HAD superfamily hydrolase (TIGR01490 family)
MNLALFDLDGTLIERDSDHAFGEYLVQQGWADAAEFKRCNDQFYQQYLDGGLDVHAYVDFATGPWRRRPEADALALREHFMRDVVHAMLTPAARALVQRHQQAGDTVAIVTATNEFVTRPIATALGVDTLIATELARDAQGRCTGAIHGTPCFREGKVARIDQWLAAQGRRWAGVRHSVFYSDSANDLPLLERVHEPVATNPGASLEAVARQRGWRILRLFE